MAEGNVEEIVKESRDFFLYRNMELPFNHDNPSACWRGLIKRWNAMDIGAQLMVINDVIQSYKKMEAEARANIEYAGRSILEPEGMEYLMKADESLAKARHCLKVLRHIEPDG